MAVHPRAGGGPPEFGLTVTDLLEVRAASHGSRVFALLPDTRGHLAFADLNDKATRFANVLHALGLRAGDRVALVLANGSEFLLTFFGALKLGAWVAVIDPAAGAEGTAACLQRVRPKAVATAGERWVAQVAAARDQGAWSGELVAFGLRRSRRRVLRGEQLLEAAPPVLYGEIAELLKERGAGGLITFTWQPPNVPLGVMLPETALAHVAASLTGRLGLGAGDRTVPLASLSHRQGMILTLL
ncbi:MAG TPA: class I adenylate-forming enzyme family protein, partial [Bacillota bacterium]